MTFHSPLAFLVLLVIPLVVWRHLRRKRPALRFSSASLPRRAGMSVRQHFLHLPLALRVLTLVLLAVALARPQEGMEKIHDINRGIAIEMVVDRSSSMGAEMQIDGRTLTRLDAVKRVFAEFVNGNHKDLAGRDSDLIGMVTFARFADTICPLTLAHEPLGGFLDLVRLVDTKSEDGTAIGDGIMVAAARLRTAEEELARQTATKKDSYEIKSKIIILLTDGRNNVGRYSPAEAAAQAKEWGIKIYTVGVGGNDEFSMPGLLGFKLGGPQAVDEGLLRSIAESTGGVFRMANDGEGLRDIYREIDKLEKSEVENVRFVDYKEHFQPFALLALGLMVLELTLSATVFRRLP